MPRNLPITFVPDHLALNEGQLFEVLGLNDGRPAIAKKRRFIVRWPSLNWRTSGCQGGCCRWQNWNAP